MSVNFRSSYTEMLSSGLRYTHSGLPTAMKYRETEEYPNLEQIQRINEGRDLKHHILEIKVKNTLNEDPPIPPAFRAVKPDEIEKIAKRLNSSKTTASSGELDEKSAKRIERATKRGEGRILAYRKMTRAEQREMIERLSTPNTMSRLRSEAVRQQHGGRAVSACYPRPDRSPEQAAQPRPKSTASPRRRLNRAPSANSIGSLDSTRTN